jgi:bifunctional non-homologous end joining protein LigD
MSLRQAHTLRRRMPPDHPLMTLAPHIQPAPMPARLSPMLCTFVAEPFDDPAWIFEPKYDGLRLLARFDGRDLTLLSRRSVSQNFQFPEVVASLRESLTRPVLVDGELVCLDEHGRSSFRSLQQRFHLMHGREVETRMRQHPAYFYVFDLLYVDSYDVMPLPLKARKATLREVIRWSEGIRWTEYEGGQSQALWGQACRDGREGIIGKHLDSPYVQARSSWWVKIKCTGRQEFVIGGFTDPQRSRVGLGALLIGYYSDDGKHLIYAGKVGTGYTNEVLLDLRTRLDALVQRVSPFAVGDLPHGPGVHWVRPQLVAEVAFGEWTQHGRLRQPRFEGLHPDKTPSECRRERPTTGIQPGALPDDGIAQGRTARAHITDQPTGTGRTEKVSMALDVYGAKRDFDQTPEPPPTPAPMDIRARHQLIFVVQEHHASRLHYDFRLEAEGVLKSWAVPRPPSMDPSQKRLAIHVEDHPLAYATFTGTIPAGQYGAGTVSIWDHGTYEHGHADRSNPQTVTEDIEAGHLALTLHGSRLQGQFALIRMHRQGRGKEQWLLIKKQDAFAHPEGRMGINAQERRRTKSENPRSRTSSRIPKRTPAQGTRTSKPSEADLTFTHPERLMYPEVGLTKGDVLKFYQLIAPRLLPYLRDRPATLERLPEGLDGPNAPHFWQKRTPDFYPEWIQRIVLPSEDGTEVPYVLVNDEVTLLYLVNQGTLTFHVGCSRIADLDRPDCVLFDLDPGQAGMADVVAVAKALHRHLQSERHEAFVKTSGKTGLHVLVPWERATDYAEARAWAIGKAQKVVAALPDQATTERSKAKRGARVYVDVIQNAKGHHAVPPYVLRAVPRAPVSTPLDWQELTANLDPIAYNLKTIFRRLARQRHDPMSGLLRVVTRAP